MVAMWDQIRNPFSLQVRSVKKEADDDVEWPLIYTAEWQKYEKDSLHNWTGGVYRLPQPWLIIKDHDFPIIQHENYRIYSPFKLNVGKAYDHLVRDAKIPDPKGEITRPESGVHSVEPSAKLEGEYDLVTGLRVDLRSEVAEKRFFHNILSTLRTTSLQWWVDGATSPFEPERVASFSLDRDFSFKLERKRRGLVKMPSSWITESALASPFGFEHPISPHIWSEFAAKLNRGSDDDLPISFMLDGVAAFMSHHDRQCIYMLWNSLESMERYARRIESRPTGKYGLQLLQGARIWDQTDRHLLSKFYKDRNDVAHGNFPRIFKAQPSVLMEYLHLTTRYGIRYLVDYLDSPFIYSMPD